MQRRPIVVAAAVTLLPRQAAAQAALLAITGQVQRPLALSRVDLLALKRRDELLDTECVPSLRSLQDVRSGPRHVKC